MIDRGVPRFNSNMGTLLSVVKVILKITKKEYMNYAKRFDCWNKKCTEHHTEKI